MSVCGNKIIYGALLVLSLALGATAMAMDLGQSGTGGQTTPSFTLPSFLDNARLPDLQEAWKARESRSIVAPRAGDSAAGQSSASSDEEAFSDARAATQRTEQTSPQDRAVRQRAEELSQRFGSEDAAAKPEGEGENPSGDAPPSGTAAQQVPDQVEQAAIEVPEGRGAGASDVPALSPVRPTRVPSARRQGAAIAKERRVEAPVEGSAGPPMPERTPRDTAPPRKSRPPSSAQASTIMPTELRAFGWDAQQDQ